MEYVLEEPGYNGRGKIKYIINGDCWDCTHPKHLLNNGYRLVTRNKEAVLIHRYVYSIYNGKIPKGKIIMHICDNKNCVNPNHFKLGTHDDNMVDMLQKNRHRSGMKGRNQTEEAKRKISDGLFKYYSKK